MELKKHKGADLSQGVPWKSLLAFTTPILLGNIFQQMYNLVDTIVVGQCIGASALAAVGASAAIVFILICVSTGLSMGCSILISQNYGAKDYKTMRQLAFNTLFLVMGIGIILSLLGSFFSKEILILSQIPEDILVDGVAYLKIYCLGGIFMFAYNTIAAICRGIGDSKTPLYYLIITTVLNIILDLYFVVNLDMGVSGVAWATLISQGISVVGCGVHVYWKIPILRFKSEDRVISAKQIWELLQVAVPSTIQQSILSISLAMVQGLVNTFGTEIIAGYTAACKVDNFVVMPLASFNIGISTYTAQNVGAGRIDRVQKGYRAAMVMVVGLALISTLFIWMFDTHLLGMFLDVDSNYLAMNSGRHYIHIVAGSYILIAMMFVPGSILRGGGQVNLFLIASIINLGSRVMSAYWLASILGFDGISWSIPVGWFIGWAFNEIFYRLTLGKKLK